MRFYEFKQTLAPSPNKPTANTDIAQSLDSIEDMASEDPKALQVAKQGLAKLRDYVNKIKSQLNQTPQKEAVAVSSVDMISQLSAEKTKIENDIEEICKEMGNACNKYVENMRQFLAKLEKQLEQLVGVSKGEGKEEAEKEFNKWYNSVGSVLSQLGKKAQGYTEVTADELKAMTSKQRSSYKNITINAEKFASELGVGLKSLFLDVLFSDKNTTNIKTEHVSDFLTNALNGTVIDNAKMVSVDQGNIDNFVNKKHKKVYDAIKDRLIGLKPPGSGGANIGPGELALSMLGNPSAKATKGDLMIGEEMYEIKAGAGTVGGRFNSDQVTTAFTGWSTFDKELKKIAPNVELRGKSAKGKDGSYYNWNDKGIGLLNDQILSQFSDLEQTYNLLYNTFKVIIKNYEELPNFENHIRAMIMKDGTINKDTYMNHYSGILYESYAEADGVTNIMIIDTAARDYAIIRNGNDLSEKLGKIVRTSGGFNWNDNHQKASPQFVLQK